MLRLSPSCDFVGLNEEFTFDRGFLPMPGWSLSTMWLSEEGLPKKGLLSLEMFAGEGMRQLGCCVDPKLRMMLSSLVLVSQRDYRKEIDRGDLLSEEKMFNYERGSRHPVNYFPNLTLKSAQHLPPGTNSGTTTTAATTAITALHSPTKSSHHHSSHHHHSHKSGRKSKASRSILPVERDGRYSPLPSDSENDPYRSGTVSPVPEFANEDPKAMLRVQNPDYRPLLPLVKLMAQSQLLAQLNTAPDGSHTNRPNSAASAHHHHAATSTTVATGLTASLDYYAFTFEDCNRHLADETDVTWNYGATSHKYEGWLNR